MKSKIIKEVVIDKSGVESFIELCKTGDFSEIVIENFLENEAYKRLIELGGPNIGMDSKSKWIEIFYKALNDETIDFENSHIMKILFENMIKPIRWASKNLDKIKEFTDIIIHEINKSEFIEIVANYVPKNISMDKIRINLVVFMNNGFGVGEEMIIDVPFLGSMTSDGISRILAHELHHMLRTKVEVPYCIEDEYAGVNQALFWLESEGIADLCNYKETSKIYENFGYVEQGKFAEITLNMRHHITEFNNALDLDLNHDFERVNSKNYLSNNISFHPIGYFMAKYICSVLGEEQLQNCVGDPYKFIVTYNKAAKLTEDLKKVSSIDESVIQALNEVYQKK